MKKTGVVCNTLILCSYNAFEILYINYSPNILELISYFNETSFGLLCFVFLLKQNYLFLNIMKDQKINIFIQLNVRTVTVQDQL